MSDKRDWHREFQDEYAVALAQAVDAAAEEEKIEETRKSFLAAFIHHERGNQSMAVVTAAAQCEEDYTRLTEALIYARKATAAAKARVKFLEMRWETWRTRSSDRRAELRRQEHAQAQQG